jgi:hypothetical protein
VYKMEPSVPVDGMTIATRGDDTANLAKLPPHLGRWSKIDQSQSIILMAFRYMDNPVNASTDPSLPQNTLGIYFGPEPSSSQTIPSNQKIARKPLIGFLSTANVVEQACLLSQNEQCKRSYVTWQSEVLRYLQDQEFSLEIITKWENLSRNTENFSVENMKKQETLLMMIFLGRE